MRIPLKSSSQEGLTRIIVLMLVMLSTVHSIIQRSMAPAGGIAQPEH